MRLGDYPTPKTNAFYSETSFRTDGESQEFAESLERKLARSSDIIRAAIAGFEKAGMPNAAAILTELLQETEP